MSKQQLKLIMPMAGNGSRFAVSLQILLDMRTRCFWHDKDTVTLTNDGHIWCYPGNFPRHKRSVWLDLEDIPLPEDTTGIYGICGDKK
jgi:hypothetical protein